MALLCNAVQFISLAALLLSSSITTTNASPTLKPRSDAPAPHILARDPSMMPFGPPGPSDPPPGLPSFPPPGGQQGTQQGTQSGSQQGSQSGTQSGSQQGSQSGSQSGTAGTAATNQGSGNTPVVGSTSSLSAGTSPYNATANNITSAGPATNSGSQANAAANPATQANTASNPGTQSGPAANAGAQSGPAATDGTQADPTTPGNATTFLPIEPGFNTDCVDRNGSASWSACQSAVEQLMLNLTGRGYRAVRPANDLNITLYNNTHFAKTENGDPSKPGGTCIAIFQAHTFDETVSVPPSWIHDGFIEGLTRCAGTPRASKYGRTTVESDPAGFGTWRIIGNYSSADIPRNDGETAIPVDGRYLNTTSLSSSSSSGSKSGMSGPAGTSGGTGTNAVKPIAAQSNQTGQTGSTINNAVNPATNPATNAGNPPTNVGNAANAANAANAGPSLLQTNSGPDAQANPPTIDAESLRAGIGS